MSKLWLICRLAGRDIRRRPVQAALLLLAITAASATLTMGLALRGVTHHPYQRTRAITNGADVVAQLGGGPALTTLGGLKSTPPPNGTKQVTAQARALAGAPGVTEHSGPYLVAGAVLRVGKLASTAQIIGTSQVPATVNHPALTTGSWVRPGGVVLERTFADALGVGVGDRITLNGRPFRVAGIAVTAASTPYPNLCFWASAFCPASLPTHNVPDSGPGLGWVTQPDARLLAVADGGASAYVEYLKLSDPANAQAFATAFDRAHPAFERPIEHPEFGFLPSLTPWQQFATEAGLLVQDEQQVLTPGAWLLALLAMASVAVLAGGRMAEHTRRVGLLKAVGGTPGFVAGVLLAENVLLALASAAAGLAIGWLAAPLITSPGAGLVGAPGAPSLTVLTAGEVVAVALAVALASTALPAFRAARTSTVGALADAARAPRRRAVLIRASARLPVPLLFGLRLVARRPRRAILGAVSIAVTVTGVVAVLAFHTQADQHIGRYTELSNPVVSRDEQMLLVITIALLALSALNAICTAWATVLDARHASVLARALGASLRQVSAGLAAAQVLPALLGAIIGIPLGIGLFAAASHAGQVSVPRVGWLIATVLGTLVVVAALTMIPTRMGGSRPVAEVLRQEA